VSGLAVDEGYAENAGEAADGVDDQRARAASELSAMPQGRAAVKSDLVAGGEALIDELGGEASGWCS
jgi:hypothetical protein